MSEFNIAMALAGESTPLLIDGRWWLPIAFYPSRQRVILVDAHAPAKSITDAELARILEKQP